MLFLGGKESSTLKEISETLGKETIDLYNTSDTRGQSRSYGMNYQKTGKELGSLTVGYQKKVPAGRIKPAFFVSNFWFLSIVFYCNVL